MSLTPRKESYVEKVVQENILAKNGYISKKQGNLFQKSGEADFFACVNGQAISIETKARNGHAITMAQLYEGYKFTVSGGLFIIAYEDYVDYTELPSYTFGLSKEAVLSRNATDLSLKDYSILEKIYNAVNKEKISKIFTN